MRHVILRSLFDHGHAVSRFVEADLVHVSPHEHDAPPIGLFQVLIQRRIRHPSRGEPDALVLDGDASGSIGNIERDDDVSCLVASVAMFDRVDQRLLDREFDREARRLIKPVPGDCIQYRLLGAGDLLETAGQNQSGCCWLMPQRPAYLSRPDRLLEAVEGFLAGLADLEQFVQLRDLEHLVDLRIDFRQAQLAIFLTDFIVDRDQRPQSR